ncbi:MAG TPA: glycosyltransferase family 2 protein [Actinomycetota bacterium]
MPALAFVAARDEESRVGETVRAIRDLPVDEIVVVDDGSRDGTAAEALAAGARVLVAPRPMGKGEALEAALDRAPAADVYLFLDGDLGATASAAVPLLELVRDGKADLAIAELPRQPGHGGFRVVKRLSARLIRSLSGFRAREPMSGQRAMTREVLEAVRPLAPGFGVETAMTIDAVRAGFRVMEVEVPMSHRVTGRDLAGFAHRARQGRDVLAAAWPRAIGRR